uniref:Doublecortin domain-containing protein n=1 Tax=Parastrongyloides trichosuri TaxID=131310 RepID=A0A0N4ZMD4_PARTI
MTENGRLIYWLGSFLFKGPEFKKVVEDPLQNDYSNNNKEIYKRNGALKQNWIYSINKTPVYINTGVESLAKLIFLFPDEFQDYCDLHLFSINKKEAILLQCNRYFPLKSEKLHFSMENFKRQSIGAKFFGWKISLSYLKRIPTITPGIREGKVSGNSRKKKDKHISGYSETDSKEYTRGSSKKARNKYAKNIKSMDSQRPMKNKSETPVSASNASTTKEDSSVDAYCKWLIKESSNRTEQLEKNQGGTIEQRPGYDDLDELLEKVDSYKKTKEDKGNVTEESSASVHKNTESKNNSDKLNKTPPSK